MAHFLVVKGTRRASMILFGLLWTFLEAANSMQRRGTILPGAAHGTCCVKPSFPGLGKADDLAAQCNLSAPQLLA